MDLITLATTYGVAAISVMAFVVSLIVEVIKNVGFFKRIPTDLVVIVLSCIVTVLSYVCLVGYFQRAFVWYEVILAFASSFVVAFVAMYGWKTFKGLWDRFRK